MTTVLKYMKIDSSAFMDPTKSFDHLDPKLKDTYARVMGTTTNGTSPTPPADPLSSAMPATTFDPAQLSADPNQTPAAPLSPLSPPTADPNIGPNPGTGPTITTMPQDTTAVMTPPADTSVTNIGPASNTPPTNGFFSNPSPASTDLSQPPADAAASDLSAPIQPPADAASVMPAAPVTPSYSPEDMNAAQAGANQFSQPLPSPAAVAQAAPHQASALLKVIYIIVAVIFFAAYTVFWIKIFNLPFLF